MAHTGYGAFQIVRCSPRRFDARTCRCPAHACRRAFRALQKVLLRLPGNSERFSTSSPESCEAFAEGLVTQEHLAVLAAAGEEDQVAVRVVHLTPGVLDDDSVVPFEDVAGPRKPCWWRSPVGCKHRLGCRTNDCPPDGASPGSAWSGKNGCKAYTIVPVTNLRRRVGHGPTKPARRFIRSMIFRLASIACRHFG